MFIKGNAFAAEELSLEQLKALQKGDTIALGIRSSGATEPMIVTVHVSATSLKARIIRIEGHTYHNHKRANVIAQLFIDPTITEDGGAELTFYS